jgi:hypothetical protein
MLLRTVKHHLYSTNPDFRVERTLLSAALDVDSQIIRKSKTTPTSKSTAANKSVRPARSKSKLPLCAYLIQ